MTWILFNAVVSCAEWFWSTSITITNLDCIFRLPSSLLHPPSPFFSFYFPPPLPSPDVFLPLYFLHLFFFSDPSSLALYFYLAGRCSRGWYCPHQQPVQWLPFSPTRGCGYWETWWGKLLHLSGQGQILSLLLLIFAHMVLLQPVFPATLTDQTYTDTQITHQHKPTHTTQHTACLYYCSLSWTPCGCGFTLSVANHSLGVKVVETCVCVMIRNFPDCEITEIEAAKISMHYYWYTSKQLAVYSVTFIHSRHPRKDYEIKINLSAYLLSPS